MIESSNYTLINNTIVRQYGNQKHETNYTHI